MAFPPYYLEVILSGDVACFVTMVMYAILQREVVIGLDMQQLHHLGCDWTNDGQMFFTSRN